MVASNQRILSAGIGNVTVFSCQEGCKIYNAVTVSNRNGLYEVGLACEETYLTNIDNSEVSHRRLGP